MADFYHDGIVTTRNRLNKPIDLVFPILLLRIGNLAMQGIVAQFKAAPSPENRGAAGKAPTKTSSTGIVRPSWRY
jgi:hypothetical protein